MRPTDEDQPGTRRPNLMSSGRRSGSEVNILDMLDRQAKGPLRRRMLRSVLDRSPRFWYGAGGVLACALAGALAWLVHTARPAAVDTALAGSIKPPAPVIETVDETVGNAPLTASKTAAGSNAASAAGAAIVDLAPPSDTEADAATLTVAPATAGAVPAAALAAPAAVPPAARPLPPRQAAGRIAAQSVPRDPPRPTAHATAAKTAPRAARSLAHAEAAARSRRQAAAVKPAAPALDTDVALISAIIQHAAARQEAEEAARKP